MHTLKNNFNALLRLTIPLALTGVIESGIWFFETIFLSHLSSEALAAGSLVSWSYGAIIVIIFGTLGAINILVAHKYGAKDERAIFLIARDGFWLAILLSIPIFFLFWNMSEIFMLLGQSPAIVLLAKQYLHAMAWGIFPTVVTIAIFEVIMGLGRTRIIFLASIFSVSLNIILSFCLIFGKFGLPMLGIIGAGLGLTFTHWITAVLLCGFILINTDYKRYFCLVFHPSQSSYLKELLYTGIPIGFMYCVEVSFFCALTLIMGSLGNVFIAANQIALQYLGILIGIIFSIAQAVTVRMGHLLGAGDKILAKQSAYLGVVISILFMFLVALCYLFFPQYLISIDFDTNKPENLELVHIATQLLYVSALFQIFEATRISLFGALRALKDTRFTLFISVLSFWGIALPVGYFIATYLNFGAVGLWWGMVLGAGFSSLLLFWRFKIKILCY